MPSPTVLEIRLPPSAPIDISTDRKLHETVKAAPEYERAFPKASFVKSSKITSKDFLQGNPLIGRVKWGRKTFYVYSRANRAADHGEPLVAKKFSIRKSLADSLEAMAARSGEPQVQLVEQALSLYLQQRAASETA